MSVTTMSPPKTAELIEMLFEMWTWVGPRNYVSDEFQISHMKAHS